MSSLFIVHGFTQTPLNEAIDFTGIDTDGNIWNLFTELDAGKYVLIDFFLTTWPNCTASAPHLQESFEYFGCGDYDVRYFAINYGQTDAVIKDYELTLGLTYPSISGIEGGGNQIVLDYQIQVAPTVILIAPDHSIVIQSIWPIPNAQAIIDELEVYDISENECIADPLQANLEVDNTDPCILELIQFQSASTGNIDSYNWTFEGGFPETSNEENPFVTYEQSGVFDVSLTVTSGSEENTIVMEDYITVHNCTGIENLNIKMSISPNPGDGHFNVSLPDNGTYEVQIFDVAGQEIYTTKLTSALNQLDISHLNNGVYILNANNGSTQLRERVVIK